MPCQPAMQATQGTGALAAALRGRPGPGWVVGTGQPGVTNLAVSGHMGCPWAPGTELQ